MSKLLEMIEKRNKAWEGAKAFVEANKDKDGLLTEEQTKQYQEMEQKVLNFSKEIDRLQREEQLDKLMEKPINTPIKEKPRQEDIEEKTGRASTAYKNSMLQALRSNFKQVSNVLQEGVDADGGYLVPEEYDQRLIGVLEEENIVRHLATVITTAGNHKINIAGTSPAAAWIDEGAELKFGEAKFSQMLLDAHKLHVAIKVTEELLYDSAFNLETYITEQFGKALANAEEDAFLNGDGNNKPTGIFHETNGGTFLDKVTAIKADDVINLIHALKRPYRKNAVFITNDKTIAQIRKFKDSNGAYIWQPSYQQGEPDKVLGYPIYTSAYAPENAIAFGDFSYYNIGDRGARSFKALTELFAGNGMIGYVAKERVDGKLILPEAVQILSING
ncbi:phage major capsid protein [Tuanshanicoccus lijuaniae]|uniref:phage major capsid protein n=1 Tax=Aerococcaceae bacterium zg-1292 TaxID=2774330 RepID=UPI0019369A00|nr:phage major capsid protein [Aerococcaceae bacterium zg-1292]QQA38051.1 phage major capsid protein [Aerococcaceae bacterium zg-1292]